MFNAGANPTRVRLLLPVNTTDEELDAGFAMLEKALRRVAAEREVDVLILRPVAERDLDDLRRARGAARLDEPAERSRVPRRAHRDLAALVRAAAAASAATGAARLHRSCSRTSRARRCVGTSLILAKHGTPEAPYYWLEVSTEERRSPELQQALRARQAAAALDRRRPHRDRRPDPRPGVSRATRRSAARRSRSCASPTSRRTPSASSAR